MADLTGKVAVVTGAGSGMGRAVALAFVRHGARVLACDISGREAETARDGGEAVRAHRCDVSQEAEVEAMMSAAIAAFGRLDAVLNVAGIGVPGLLGDLDMAGYDKVMDVDLRGVVLGTKHAIRAMTPLGGGVILNWSSIGGFGATRGWGAYGAAKAGVISITQTAALEYAAQGVRANVICPGTIFTEMWEGVPPDRVAMRAAHVPQGRLGTPEEVADLAVFLASDRAAYINGAVIAIDGGQSCQVP
jgi:NAD(P)-dependent dehydrogenase (short-subunit alcohol dehydrogenase family)